MKKIFMPKLKILITLPIILLAIFYFGKSVNAAVIFQDDFESDLSNWKCTDGQLSKWDPGWMYCGTTAGFGAEWKMGPGHNSNNAVYSWKKNILALSGYRTASTKWFTGADVKTEIYQRWYMKIPPADQYNKTCNLGFKFWRYILREYGYSNPREIYLNVHYTTKFADGNFWILSGSIVKSLSPVSDVNDNIWHCFELHLKLNSYGNSDGIIEWWVDGVLKASQYNFNWGADSQTPLGFHCLSQFGIGNTTEEYAFDQTEWSAIAFDDVVLSTNYIGPLTPSDTQAPTVPTNLSATAISSSQINLSWIASTDNVGVTGYRIYRCQGTGCTPTTQIATSATNSYSDTGLSLSTTYVYRVAAYDAAGNVSAQSSSAPATTQAGTVTILFQELFEDTNFSSRSWYDSTGGTLSATEHISGSTRSLECRFNQGGTSCAGGSPARHLFNETDNVYLDYWVKYSSNYIGTGASAGPHEFHFLTNKDGTYIGPAGTHLTTYIEQNSGTPRLGIQDMLSVDTNCILRNDGSFVGCNGNFSTYPFTENRSVASCNGIMGGYDKSDCFQWDSTSWYSARLWDTSQAYFRNEPNQWHHVKVQFKMNSISGGKGVTDGKLKYWLDGRLIISYDNILLRTAVNADMKFNQFFIAPYIGNGSSVTQTMWIDDLSVYTEASTPDTAPPAAPSGVTIS